MTPTNSTPRDPNKIHTNQRAGIVNSVGAYDERTPDLLLFTQLTSSPERHQETTRGMGR